MYSILSKFSPPLVLNGAHRGTLLAILLLKPSALSSSVIYTSLPHILAGNHLVFIRITLTTLLLYFHNQERHYVSCYCRIIAYCRLNIQQNISLINIFA